MNSTRGTHLYRYVAATCAAVAVLLAAETSRAELRINDSWSDAGLFRIEGAGWTAQVLRSGDGIRFEHGAYAAILAFLGPADAEPMAITSCKMGDGPAAQLAIGLEKKGRRGAVKAAFSERGDVSITPEEGVASLCVKLPVEIGLLPGNLLESVAYLPQDFPRNAEIAVPPENWVAGLATGRGAIAMLAWPAGRQRISLRLEGEGKDRIFSALNLYLDGKEAYFGLLCADGIWHREKASPSHLERDIKLGWKRPFEAVWRAELPIKAETTALRTFEFSPARRSLWRPEIGSYVWPLWFDKDDAFIHYSKRIPPTSDAIIYPISGHDSSIIGFMNRTPMAKEIAERGQRRPLPLGPRNVPNVGFNACWGTFLLRRSVYAAGAQNREKDFLREHALFLADYVAIIQARNRGYFEFIKRMKKKTAQLKATAGDPAAARFLEAMEKRIAELEAGHKEKMALFGEDKPEQHVARADRYAERLIQLLDTPGREVFPECWHLLDSFNRMSWGHDEATGMRFNMLARDWARECAVLCADNPSIAPLAAEIRADILDALKSAAPW